MDIQFSSESSLPLAQYVTGYITKAEKSHMQEIWEEISDDDSLYKRLYKFGIKSLRTQECGFYEASDLLLGDHLCEKSDTVQFVSTCSIRVILNGSIINTVNYHRYHDIITKD